MTTGDVESIGTPGNGKMVNGNRNPINRAKTGTKAKKIRNRSPCLPRIEIGFSHVLLISNTILAKNITQTNHSMIEDGKII
jgi:hypothetical protein